MNYHQSLKSEVEARSRSVLQCIEMGKTLLAARNPAAEEVTTVTPVGSPLPKPTPHFSVMYRMLFWRPAGTSDTDSTPEVGSR